MPSSPSNRSGRSAAVTVAGGGLGRDIAIGLARKGYAAFGTAMSANEIEDLKAIPDGGVQLAVCYAFLPALRKVAPRLQVVGLG